MKISFLFFFAVILAGFSAKSQCTAQFDYTAVGCDSLYFTPDTVYSQSMYVWNFGDGSTSNDPNAIHVYASNGTYNVSLLVFDSLNNCANDYILAVTVACDSVAVIDSCNIDFSIDFVTCDSVWFVPSIYNPSATYQWDMGDGNTYNWEGNGYTYAADGTYLVMLYYIDSISNCWGIAEHFVTIACDSVPVIDSCSADFDHNFITCDSVWFMPSVYEPSALYSWNFGDGTVGYGAPMTHYYTNDGSYPVTLIVEDTLNNCANVFTYYVNVWCDSVPPIDSCNIDFSIDFVTCDSVWFMPSINNPSATYQWDMGDGNTFNWTDGDGYTYAADGTYLVMLYYIDSISNCWGIAEHFVTIDCDSVPTVDSCNAAFNFNFATCDSVWFYPVDYNSNAYYSWNFGDGHVAYDGITSHQYSAQGTYAVTLTVEDTVNNCWQIVTHVVDIFCDSVPPVDSCSANFEYDFVTCDSVYFAPSLYQPTAFYIWNFGEGASDHNPFTAHQYSHDGSFVVTLTVIDCSNNCSASYTTTLNVDCDSTLGIQPVTDENTLTVYPNPGTGIFYVELESEDATIQVYDLTGNMVLNTGCTDACNNFALDLSHLANGAYSVVVVANGDMQSTRIIKN